MIKITQQYIIIRCLYFAQERPLDLPCTTSLQCATADAECTDDGSGSKCVCKSTHFKDGSLCSKSRFNTALFIFNKETSPTLKTL